MARIDELRLMLQALLREHRAVGDVLVHFSDSQGRPVNTHLDNRVIGMSLDQLKRVKWSVGIAGGERKHEAIRAAVLGDLGQRANH